MFEIVFASSLSVITITRVPIESLSGNIQHKPFGKWSKLISSPIYLVYVFSTLIFRPAHWLNLFNVLIVCLTDSISERSRIISSANKLILIYILFIFIPFILLWFTIVLVNLSSIVINKRTDGGDIFFTSLCSLNMCPVLPLISTVDTIFVYIIMT